MDNLEKIIRGNRDLFNQEEPSEGHLERFQTLLEMRFAPKRKVSIGPYLLKAAVVTILVTLSSLWTWDNFIRPDGAGLSLGEISPGYRDMERHYTHQVSLMRDEIIEIDLGEEGEHKRMLDEELEKMDEVMSELRHELRANPGDERVVRAMIQHYQTKLEVMSYILNQLREIEKEKSELISGDDEAVTI